ncbi:Membrane protein involved in the export of O-antigen and teichoic acid [Saccharicrinis carchari]|uniref:Membrane protein involved in the export of O-antigen and teichoic acid n=1 Tax=Saccharicrinis carchari TaxID=1168039 RepID=A0A521BS36_SACCC|nr:O-antigen translocase [Saccharicrinis carchari]SMO49964.1 Membrane protein involved in the export of O-antigen and teichoic acid [Saccharicrinis carchari]
MEKNLNNSENSAPSKLASLENLSREQQTNNAKTNKEKTDKEDQSSYRQIFKATSLFGGVQVINILIGIIRVKFIAVLLGTAGVGILGLLNAPLQLIISIAGLGIAFSAVRDISEAQGTGDKSRIAKTILTVKRWTWFTGLLAAVITLSLSPLLSQWSFGNSDYTWAFVWLSVTLFLQAISDGQKAILQGMRRLQDLAKSGVIGSALGLLTSIPLYYFYGLKGIVPSFIVTAVTVLFLTWYFSRKVKTDKVELTPKETWKKGLGMAQLGISMTLAGFITTLSTYILNAYISNTGGVEQVGLYNAGWGVVGQYTGIVFTAMATDYFPRLSAIQHDNLKVRKLVSQQAETALLIMAPLLALLIVTMPLAVRVLYTSAFLPIVMFANLTVLGMQLKAVSWSMGYVFLAKGDGRLFLILEIVSGAFILGLNLLFYYLYGLNGLGISFILSFLFGVVLSYAVLNKKYQFRLSKKFYGRFLITYSIVVLSFITVFIPDEIVRYGAGTGVLIIAIVYSYYKLNELMDIKQLVLDKLNKL